MIGVLNTVIDFAVFNVLVVFVSLSVYPASLVSTTIALAFSYFANSSFVFKENRTKRNMILFVVLTLFGLWVLHSGGLVVIDKLLSDVSSFENNEVLRNNIAKVLATLLSAVWNYVTYKYIVFTNGGNKKEDTTEENRS